ncbi:MAG: thioredoxin family protein [Bacteroidetes bacterium]|nr:thioredoxin family protein [Bacteroidota bacterium]
MRFLSRLILLLTILFHAGFAQSQIIQDPTTWTYELKKTGDNHYRLFFHLKLKEGWHIYSFNPGGDGTLIAPSFRFDPASFFKKNGKTQEHGKLETKVRDGVDGAVHEFHNKVDYTQDITVTGNGKITGTLEYQVCDESMCLPPKHKAFSFEIKDASPTGTEAALSPSGDTSTKDSNARAAAPNTTVKSHPDSSQMALSAEPVTPAKPEAPTTNLWLLFALCLGGGLLAITTPCVYSMVPITVSFFTKRSKTRAEAIRNAIYYSLSIIIIFTVLGVIISAAFGPQALYKLSSNWIANLFFFAVFVVFGISFLGAFEITLPSSWTSKTDSRAGTGSFKGIFFMALTLVIVSFSCTSGIIGPLLVAASRGGLVGPALGMFGFSLGLALPFTFFAFSPGLINKMANAGGWLNQVKVTLGFVEIALALKFFSNADLVKGWRILDREIFIALWIVIAILLGLYLLGKLKLSHDDANPKNIYGQEYVSLFKLFLAFSSFAFAVYLMPGMWGAPLKGLGQFLPPMGTQDYVVSSGGSLASANSESHTATPGNGPVKYVDAMRVYEPNVVKNNGLVTYFDYDEALAASRREHKPVMLDFTGITCVNCRLMETNVWSAPEVMKRMKEDFIVASLYCDASQVPLPKDEQYYSKVLGTQVTTLGDRSLDLQISKFNSNSQPFYFFVDADGKLLADKGYGTNTDVARFVAHLDAVKARYKELHP